METNKKNLIIIHGAGPKHYRSLSDGTGDWQLTLATSFLKDCRVITPQMPGPTKPSYEEWKFILDKNLKRLKGEVIFVGHSLGGSFLVKYLAEEQMKQKISGLYLVAAPFNSVKGFEIPSDLSTIPPIDHKYLYYCKDDVEVPFAHSANFKEGLNGTLKKFEDRGHYFKKKPFPEIIQDIRVSLTQKHAHFAA